VKLILDLSDCIISDGIGCMVGPKLLRVVEATRGVGERESSEAMKPVILRLGMNKRAITIAKRTCQCRQVMHSLF
jgi:hypothetical protein